MQVLEKHIEQRFLRKAKSYDLFILKLSFLGQRGAPDRLVIGPDKFIDFIEFKAPGKKPTRLQSWTHKALGSYGFNVKIIDSKEKVDRYFEELGQTAKLPESNGPRYGSKPKPRRVSRPRFR